MPASIKKLLKNNQGFTLVELNTSISLMAILGVSFLAIFSSFIVTTTRINYTIDLTNQSQGLLRVLSDELIYGAGVRANNTLIDLNKLGGWTSNSTDFVLITTAPALDSNHNYIMNLLTGKPYLNEFVYYREGNILYKRTLANLLALGNQSKTSCPPPGNALCPADRQLVDNLSSMTFSLYDEADAATTNFSLARSIKIDLTLEKRTFGTPLRFDNSVRTTLRNTL